MGVGAIAVVLFIVLFVYIYRGNKNLWLLQVCAMLLLSNVGAFLIGFSLYNIYVIKNVTEEMCVILGVGVALYYLLFGISHFLLAVKYREMSKNVPVIIEGKTPETSTLCGKITFWVLLGLNIIAPLCYGWISFVYRYRLYVLE
jgi:hypothetical protein